jgi:heme-degrading monooxygenase HmoA
MYTRIVEMTIKPGKQDELRNTMQRDVLPVLKKQPGFVDTVALVSDTDQNTLLSITFWHTRNEAERYHKDVFPTLINTLTQAITHHTVRTFNVEASTVHKIAAGKAA